MRYGTIIGRRSLVAGAIAFGLCAPAMAADPGSPEPVIEAAPLPYDWSGFYVGLHGGYGWGDADAVDPTVPDQEPEGGFGGIQIGYDYQFPNNFLFGVVADVSFGEIDDSVLSGTVLQQSGEVDYFGTVRAKAGYAVERFLPYVTAGFAWAHSEASIACPTGAGFGVCSLPDFEGQSRSDDTIATGWTVGVGLDYAFTDNWSANIEYLYADFGKDTYDLDIFGQGEVEADLNMVKLGINYRF
jgi:outer membrane immunogenic protein